MKTRLPLLFHLIPNIHRSRRTAAAHKTPPRAPRLSTFYSACARARWKITITRGEKSAKTIELHASNLAPLGAHWESSAAVMPQLAAKPSICSAFLSARLAWCEKLQVYVSKKAGTVKSDATRLVKINCDTSREDEIAASFHRDALQTQH